jgi:hypothetical protein
LAALSINRRVLLAKRLKQVVKIMVVGEKIKKKEYREGRRRSVRCEGCRLMRC